MSSEDFAALEKNAVIRTQRAVLPIKSGIAARCSIIILSFFELMMSGHFGGRRAL
jgi:hypothetical protein